MKKTVFMADITLYNPMKRHFYEHYERRVYVGEDGHGYIKMFGRLERLTDYYPTNKTQGYVREYVKLSVQGY